ncbi:HMG box-containing protein 1 [Striga asiatica]|uniref:HMG box-containing protein 1 n=1 Tax=Striga asiatica TaxID=4170 RepID=A0A5A7Q2T4_STRAF|nr:HMG box-containing protein 1 [Striga asiatica]
MTCLFFLQSTGQDLLDHGALCNIIKAEKEIHLINVFAQLTRVNYPLILPHKRNSLLFASAWFVKCVDNSERRLFVSSQPDEISPIILSSTSTLRFLFPSRLDLPDALLSPAWAEKESMLFSGSSKCSGNKS